MLTPKQIHDVEQGLAAMKEHLCPMLYGLFAGNVEAGFSNDQAMEMTIAILTLMWGRATDTHKGSDGA